MNIYVYAYKKCSRYIIIIIQHKKDAHIRKEVFESIYFIYCILILIWLWIELGIVNSIRVTILRGNISTFNNIMVHDLYDAGHLMNGFGSLEGLQQWHHGERFVLNKYLLLSHIFVI